MKERYHKTWDTIKRYVDPYTFTKYSAHTLPLEDIDGYFEYYYFGKNNIRVINKLNSFLFRSKHFEDINKNYTSILYSGCSFSYGTAMPEDMIWSSLLNKKINSDNIQHFNLSVEGGSVFLTIKNLMTFIRNYGRPNYIFIVMPPIERSIKFDRDNKRFYNVLRTSTNYFEDDFPKVYFNYIKNDKPEDDVMLAVQYIKMFEDYCNASGIKLVWTFWHVEDKKIYESIKFDNLIFNDICTNLFPNIDDVNIESQPLWNKAEDDLHPGLFWHQNIANYFYKNGKINND